MTKIVSETEVRKYRMIMLNVTEIKTYVTEIGQELSWYETNMLLVLTEYISQLKKYTDTKLKSTKYNKLKWIYDTK